jgi:hypothetical protein
MMPRRLTLIAAALLVTACQQAAIRDENSPRMRITTGSTITLHEALTVPAGHARVFLQNGKVVAKTRLNQYHPHCNFEVRSVSNGALRIEPDVFTVTAVTEDEVEVVSRMQPLRLAAWRYTGGGESTFTMLIRLVEHRLDSPRQPQVMRLTCYGGFTDPWEVAYPTVTEIRHVLGDIASVELAGG